jgi:hypothetical protein
VRNTAKRDWCCLGVPVSGPLKTATVKMVECDAEKLISLVEERQPMYAFSMKEHSNRGIQDKLLVEISTQTDVSGKY